MPVNVETPIATSTANGVTTVFPYSFTILIAADLVVTGISTTGVVTTYALGVDYTISGVGTSSGSATFLSAPANGTIITRYRATKLSRATDYQTNGDLLADTLDSDLDRTWMALQDLSVSNQAFIRGQTGETMVALPAAAARANKVLAFDSSGNAFIMVPVTGSAADVLTQITATFRSNLLLAGNGPWANPAIGDAQHLFEIVNDNGPYQCMAFNAYGAATNGNNLHWNRYRGTLAAPTAIKNGDYFMSFGMRGWDGSGTLSQSMCAFQYQATEDWTSTAHGGRIKIEITKTGGSTRLPCWKLYSGASDGAVMELGDETAAATRIINASTTGFLQLHGSQDQTGAQAIFYGAAHATFPNQTWVRADVISFQDRSGNETANFNLLSQQFLLTGKGGFGYYAGAGNSQSQSTTKGDAISSNTPTVKITMSNAALAANTAVSFTWSSTKIGADDHVMVQIRGGAGGGAYNAWCDQVNAGSARIVLKNVTAGSLSDAVVLQVSVVKGASS